MERKLCFVLEAGNLVEGGRWIPVRKPTPLNDKRAFIDGGRGPRAGTAPSPLTVVLKLGHMLV